MANSRDERMRILLINPFYPISETPSPPLGLAYLAAALEQAGARVKILDFVVYPYSQAGLETAVRSFKPHMAGATAVTMTVDHASRVLKDLKSIDPEILTVMGGPHVSFRAQKTLEETPELDLIVLGEGEQTAVELMQTVKSGGDLSAVNGIAFRRGSEITTTPGRQFIADLDTLPLPARHLLPLGRYRALGLPATLTTSRGCPYPCIFCVGRKMGGARVRYHSSDRVVTELAYLSKRQFERINIADDLFTASTDHCLSVCDAIQRHHLNIKWTAFARVDTVTAKLLSAMKAAGCTAVSFGVESANPAILKTIKKGIRLDQIRQAVRLCLKVGISPNASFMLGLPGETRDTIKETIAFANSLQQEGLAYGFHILAPFPGTEVREHADRFGIQILTDEWSEYHANRAVVETVNAGRQQLNAVVSDWEKKYFQYLGHIQKNIRAGTASADEVGQFENLQRAVTVYELMMKNMIEENGTWPHREPPVKTAKNLKLLIDRIISIHKLDPKILESALTQAVASGNLICHAMDGRVKWQWQDYL
jgi:radical SAM superfamily enzyme YgiQ (UPF0313 family)